jgi:squalene synthase HpnC
MAVDQHYENFPVASLFVPPEIRDHVVAIYRFARFADDVADEGDASDESRLAELAALHDDVARLFRAEVASISVVQGLTPLRDAAIPGVTAEPFLDLLSAFSQDVRTHRYDTFDALLDYCRRSANPVGRLMLALVGVRDPESLRASDQICSALQLINFWQDAAIDATRGRIYVPLEDFARCAVAVDDFPFRGDHKTLMQLQCDRARAMMWAGAPLTRALRGRFRFEIAFTVAGGLRILEKIQRNQFDVRIRPKLRWYDAPRLLFLATQVLFGSRRHSL